jgi:serine/threonine protein kinase
MAPELLDGKNFNKKVDVYAFGILLWEVSCGLIP